MAEQVLDEDNGFSKLRFLHLVRDDKFCDIILKAFDTDKRLINRGVLLVKTPDYKFSYIHQCDRIELLWNKNMIKKCFYSKEYDVVFIHGLTPGFYKVFRYIPKDKVVIWWSWGFDIYGGYMGTSPVLPIDKYKFQTALLQPEKGHSIKDKLRNVKYWINNVTVYKRSLRRIIPRIDYFCPVLHTEYKLMQKIDGFRAKEFFIPKSFVFGLKGTTPCDNQGSILFGNSATYTNNHLDVWNDIYPYVPEGSTIIIPISYGIKPYAHLIKEKIRSDKFNIKYLENLIPRDEYFRLLGSCTYAVFGVIRQQAMGNIYQCLQNGTKVFLYKDSMVYKDLKEDGFIVYAIEDINQNSFQKALTEEELSIQAKAFEKHRGFEMSICNNSIEEIIKEIGNSNE